MLRQLCLLIAIGLLVSAYGCSENSPPFIHDLDFPAIAEPGDDVGLQVVAYDFDEDALSYVWMINGTRLSDTTSTITWRVPETYGTYIVKLIISDGIGEDASVEKAIAVPYIYHSEDGTEMVLIPAGEFQMGDAFGENENRDELPVHTVYMDAFYMDIYEVTNAQYGKFMDATGHRAPTYWDDPDLNGPDQPVVGVNWHDTVAYAEWAGKRLPKEAEWEKAARGGLEGKNYPWGNEIASAGDTFLANYGPGDYGADGYGPTAPVGSFPPNGYGLYDMAGNVWEWCADWYDGSYYSRSPYSNPQGPDSGTARVLRGGCWGNPYYGLRVAFRIGDGPTRTNWDGYGFRCVARDIST